MKLSLCENAEHFILHVGINDLNSEHLQNCSELYRIVKPIVYFAARLKNDNDDVGVSNIILGAETGVIRK